jgi:branched-chain amino acid transport system permease protein
MRGVPLALGALLAVGASILPFALSDLALRLAILALISAIAVIGLAFAFGYCGLIHLGQAAFMGLGAYGSTLLATKAGWPVWLAVPVATLASGLIAAGLGRPLLRLREHYLALATVGLNVSFEIVAKSWVSLTGGYDGITGIPGFGVAGDPAAYAVVLGCLLASALLAVAVRHSTLGRAMIAVRDDELAAGAAGVNVVATKVTAFALAGALGGLAGALYAHYAAYISPGDFALPRSIELLAMLIVGGETSVIGAVIGAAFFTFLPEWLRALGKESYPTIFGLVTLAILILMPKGVVGTLRRLRLA